MITEIIVGILANIISTTILALLGVIIYLIIILADRQKLFRFFGVSNKLSTVRFYLSRLEIKPGGTIGFEPIHHGYSGPSINKIEFEGALLIVSQLRSALLAVLPKRIQDWLGQRQVSLISVEPIVDVSPQHIGNLSFDNLVILGSGIYNLAAKYYLDHERCHYCFDQEPSGERVIKIKSGGMRDIIIPGRASHRELAIVQCIHDEKHGNTVFLCSGLGASATYGSVRYLAENWKQLYRKYKTADFGLCLAFPGQTPDNEVVVNPVVVYESQFAD